MQTNQDGSVNLYLIIIIVILLVGGGVYFYRDSRPVSTSETANLVVNNEPASIQKTTGTQTSISPLNSSDVAKSFLESFKKDLSLNSLITPSTREISVSVSGGKTIKRQMSGYSISPSSTKAGSYFSGKAFKTDLYNTGDATFHSSQGYKNDSLICVTDYKTIAPNNDYAMCDDTPNSKCSSFSETFCANINQ